MRAVDARDHTNTNPGAEVGVPIFLLNDTLLVNDNADLWDGTIEASLQIDETGSVLMSVNAELVWTGTATSGNGEAGNELGSDTVTQGRAIGTGAKATSPFSTTSATTNIPSLCPDLEGRLGGTLCFSPRLPSS
jgi:hypothetical protein